MLSRTSKACACIALGNGEITPFVDEVMSLGVVLESTLSWRSQVNQVTKKSK